MRRNQLTHLALAALVVLTAAAPAFAAEEAAAGPLDALGINLGFLISQLINFGLLLLLLTFLLWRPVTNMLESRAAKIQKGLEDAAAAANARRNAEVEAEKILAQARSEAAQVVAQASGRGEELAKSIEAQARAEADKIKADALIEAQNLRDAELSGLRGQVTAISAALAERLIGASMDTAQQEKLVTDFFTHLPAGAADLAGDVTVISAMPLTDAEQNKVKSVMSKANVTFKVDPSILGGLIVRSGDRVIDGSVRNNLNSVVARLN